LLWRKWLPRREDGVHLLEDWEVERDQGWWDRWFLGMARYVSTASKDPSTKTGAVIVDPNRRVVSVGYNGFARKVRDTPERYACRETKYKLICHCERNAISFAQRDLEGCTLYTYPFSSCAPCAAMVIQNGISRCVAPPLPVHLQERWADDVALAQQQFVEAGVQLDFITLPEGD
jgi:dCMP deaminase